MSSDAHVETDAFLRYSPLLVASFGLIVGGGGGRNEGDFGSYSTFFI